MKKKKLPKPILSDEEMEKTEETCSCDKYEWGSHSCPYASEINNNKSKKYCTCCPYHEQQCLWAI